MAKQIFINLPVKDLQKSIDFFGKLGYSFNQQFTNHQATCMIIEEGNIYAMLLVEDFFKTFTKKQIADTTSLTEVIISLQLESKEKVDETVEKALMAGGSTFDEPVDYGWMYRHSYADPDGHQWEVFWMDPGQYPQVQPA